MGGEKRRYEGKEREETWGIDRVAVSHALLVSTRIPIDMTGILPSSATFSPNSSSFALNIQADPRVFRGSVYAFLRHQEKAYLRFESDTRKVIQLSMILLDYLHFMEDSSPTRH